MRWPWCLLVPAFVVCWYLVNGYMFGIDDHGMLVPLADRAVGSNALAGDYLFDTAHPTLLWYAYAPFVWVLGQSWAYALLHLLCIAALGVAMVSLTRAIVGDERYLLVSALALAFSIPFAWTFAGIRIADSVLIPRTVSLAPLLWALALAVRGRFFAGFVVCGLVFNLHPTTASHGAFLVGCLWVLSKPFALRRLLEPPSFLLAATPMLGVTILLGAGSQVAMPYPQEWFDLTETSWPYHHFVMRFSTFQWFMGVMPWAAWLAARSNQRHRGADVLMLAIPLFCVLGYLLIHWVRMPQAVSLHIMESTRFANYVAMVVTAAWIVRGCSESSLPRALPGLIAGLAVFVHTVYWVNPRAYDATTVSFAFLMLLAAMAAVQWWLNRISKDHPRPSGMAPGKLVVPLACAAALLNLVWLRGENPRPIHLDAESSLIQEFREYGWFHRLTYTDGATEREKSGIAAMHWVRDSLPKNAQVAVPPAFLHPFKSFRVVAERSPFVLWKDGGEVAFSEKFAYEWKRRIEAISSPEILLPFPPGQIEWAAWQERVGDLMDAFNTLSNERVLALKTEFAVTHVIRTTTSPALDLPLLYEDRAFRVYEIDAD